MPPFLVSPSPLAHPFLSPVDSHGYVCFQLGWKFLLHFFFPSWDNLLSVEDCNSGWGLSATGRFLEGCSASKKGQGWLYPRSLLSSVEVSERPFPRWVCKSNAWGKIPHRRGLQVFWFKLLKLWKLAPDEAF